MLRLAERAGEWLLFKVGTNQGSWEYWYVLPNLQYGCLNSQSKEYNAKTALGHMEQDHGKATYVRPTIGAC